MSFFYSVANSCVSVILREKKRLKESGEKKSAKSFDHFKFSARVFGRLSVYVGRLSFEHNSTLPSTEDPKVYILSTLYTHILLLNSTCGLFLF